MFKRNRTENDIANTLLKVLMQMKISDKDAREDDNYMKYNYPSIMKNKNKGGLFLIRSEFFPFFNKLLNKLILFFQSHDISICTKIVLDKFVNDLVKYSELNELWNLFESACFSLNIFENCNATNKDIYIYIYIYIIQKITIKIYHANLRQLIKEKTEKIETKIKFL